MEGHNLEELQAELVQKENIILAMHAGLAAFSTACLLRLITLPNESLLVIFSSCMFTISAVSFSFIVWSKYHVLHKAMDLHIGHVIVSEDSSRYLQSTGAACLVLGFLTMLLYISIFTFFTGLVTLIIVGKQHLAFKFKMDKLLGAREAIKKQ